MVRVFVCHHCGATVDAYPFTQTTFGEDEERTEQSFEIGYCRACSRYIQRDPATGTSTDMSWEPLCRLCREPLQLDFDRSTAHESHVYGCRRHPEERATYLPSEEQWRWELDVRKRPK
jgi:hypothetical protein